MNFYMLSCLHHANYNCSSVAPSSRTCADTKIHAYLSPIVSPPYSWILHLQIWPTTDHKHNSIYIFKNLHINGLTQFKPMLFKGQMCVCVCVCVCVCISGLFILLHWFLCLQYIVLIIADLLYVLIFEIPSSFLLLF